MQLALCCLVCLLCAACSVLLSSTEPKRRQQQTLKLRRGGEKDSGSIHCLHVDATIPPSCCEAAVTGPYLTWAFGRVASRCLKIVFSQMVTTHLQLPAAVTPDARCSQAVAVHRSGSSKGVCRAPPSGSVCAKQSGGGGTLGKQYSEAMILPSK